MLRTCISIKGAVVVGLIAALTPDLWAQSPESRLSDMAASANRTVAPPPAPAQGGLMWFTDRAAFEAFNQSAGKVLKGIEDFEESILDPNDVDGFDDPLEFGVPNLPDGFPFPNGMTGLPNLIVQSNLLGGNPTNEDPRGVDGLAALSAGFLGAVSDMVIANIGGDSLDLIFTDEKSGVGFNPISFFGAQAVEVRVYSTTNVFLGEMPSPADPTGASFIGVWSSIPIGRINIFDPGNGFEGGDNIQAWVEGGGGLCGDANCDGSFNGGDIDPFFMALVDPVAWQKQFPDCDILNLDINGDGLFNNFDIDPFFIALGGGGCP